MQPFRSHTGEYVTGDRLQDALDAVAADWTANAVAIREEDPYAAHVTEEVKDTALAEALLLAASIRRGEIDSFTVWQRVNTKLTGECVAFLP